MDEQKAVSGVEDELKRVREQEREDRKLIQRAADVLAEIDRGPVGLIDEHAEVLAALRIRLEGKPRASLEDLLTAAGDIKGKRDLGAALDKAESSSTSDDGWPEVKDEPKDWPTL